MMFEEPSVRNGSKQDICRAPGTGERRLRCSNMDLATQKLHSLARQARALSATVPDRRRAYALEALAQLYERQAKEVEALEAA